jgi:serine/threonine-protein kinase
MNDDPAVPAPRPDPEASRRRAPGANRPTAQRTPSPDTSADEWAALGATRALMEASSMDTENAHESESASDAEEAARDTGQQKTVNTLGDYRLLKKLGEGAMGVVYKARQISFPRDVAIKVLFKHIAANPKLVERFYREARVAGSLGHTNIVQGYEVGEELGFHYFVMEYVDGESLQKVLHRLGRLSVGDALHITLRCAAGLQHAHDHDVVHRDVKPDNILITTQGGVKIADLGMVKQLDEDLSLTQTGHAVGTPWYMPLEQARNSKEADGRCDIYALGCVLYCMLTGQPPFSGRTLVDVIQAKEAGTFAPARQANREVPEKLDLLLLKMIAKQVKYRYATCAEVIRDIESLGLANRTLEFLGEGAAGGPKSGRLKKAATPVPKTPVPTPVPAAVDVWYVRTEVEDGVVRTRRMTTQQLVQWIGGEQFDPATQVSRQPNANFRTLATYREFQAAVMGRATRTGADRQASKFRKQFKAIEDAELKRSREEEAEPASTTTGYWLGIFWRVAAVVGVVGVLVLILVVLANALKDVLW